MRKRFENPFKYFSPEKRMFIQYTSDNDSIDDVIAERSFSSKGTVGRKAFSSIWFRIWVMILLGVFSLLFLRHIHLQVVQGAYFRHIAEKNRIRILDVQAPRGMIFDRNMNSLTENIPNFVVELVPIDLPERDSEEFLRVLNFASSISDMTEEELMNIYRDADPWSYEPIILKENLTYEEAISAKLKSENLPGIVIDTQSKRYYLNEGVESISHILGYLGKISPEDLLDPYYRLTDKIGKSGLEASYEEVLRGQRGREQVEVNALGKRLKILASQNPIQGDSLILTIDIAIQQKLEEILRAVLVEHKKTRGSAIVINPRNGEVLGMVSLPTFDNNIFSQKTSPDTLRRIFEHPDNPLFNRAIAGMYPSGSTIKPILGAAALEEHIVTQWTTIMSTGGIQIQRWFFPDWKSGGHGPTNITKALAESVNTYFYLIGGGYQDFQGLGLEKMLFYFRKSGIGEKTGIDLPGEAAGLLPTPEWKRRTKNELWYIGDTYHLAIGQGDILVTPIQVANWTALIANGGILYQPHVVRQILLHDGTSKNVEPKILAQNIFSDKNIQIIQQGLRNAVLYGSGRALSSSPLPIAGKTGTAQWSQNKDEHAWFTGFAPYENPEVVITVIIEEGGEGSRVAVPVAREFFRWYADYRKDIQL